MEHTNGVTAFQFQGDIIFVSLNPGCSDWILAGYDLQRPSGVTARARAGASDHHQLTGRACGGIGFRQMSTLGAVCMCLAMHDTLMIMDALTSISGRTLWKCHCVN